MRVVGEGEEETWSFDRQRPKFHPHFTCSAVAEAAVAVGPGNRKHFLVKYT